MKYNKQLWDDYKSLILSLIFHALIIILTYVNLPNLSNPPTEELIISLEDLPISSISNVKEQIQQKENNEVQEIESNRNVLKSNKQEDSDLHNEKENVKDEVQKEEPVKPEVADFVMKENKEIKKKVTKPQDKPEKDSKKQNIKKQKDKQKQEQKKLDVDELDSLLKTLEDSKVKNSEEVQKNKNAKSASSKTTKAAKGTYNSNMPLSISERDSIANQIYNAWYFQAGAKNSKDMFVVLKVEVDIGGQVTNIAIDDLARYNRADAAYRVFVNSAIRAVKKASPFNGLSQERYNSWRELELNFDPRGVIF